ncbi:MAG: transcriptional repressor [Dehalococcoidia bacterium]|nr:transcriptional repressor [Dehalococcoidia bacterium]
MAHHEHILDDLRTAGVRLTPQRLLVLQTIADSPGHVSVEALYQKAKRAYPYLDIATVYRTLQLFKRLNVVTEVGLGDRLHYEMAPAGAHHHHMVCEQCGGTFDLSPEYLEEFRTRLRQTFDFTPNLDHFTVTGTCAACSTVARRPKRAAS